MAIARALVNQPALLLADEPTGNLDTTTSQEVMEVFARLRADHGITILVITHERDIAAWGTRTIDFKDGVVVQDGSTRHGRDRRLAAPRRRMTASLEGASAVASALRPPPRPAPVDRHRLQGADAEPAADRR